MAFETAPQLKAELYAIDAAIRLGLQEGCDIAGVTKGLVKRLVSTRRALTSFSNKNFFCAETHLQTSKATERGCDPRAARAQGGHGH